MARWHEMAGHRQSQRPSILRQGYPTAATGRPRWRCGSAQARWDRVVARLPAWDQAPLEGAAFRPIHPQPVTTNAAPITEAIDADALVAVATASVGEGGVAVGVPVAANAALGAAAPHRSGCQPPVPSDAGRKSLSSRAGNWHRGLLQHGTQVQVLVGHRSVLWSALKFATKPQMRDDRRHCG